MSPLNELSTNSIRSFCKHTKTVGQKVVDIFQQYMEKVPSSTCSMEDFEGILFEENTRIIGALTEKCRQYFGSNGSELGYEKFVKEQEVISRKLWDRITNLFPTESVVEEAPAAPQAPVLERGESGLLLGQEALLNIIKDHPGITSPELRKLSSLREYVFYRYLKTLRKQGRVSVEVVDNINFYSLPGANQNKASVRLSTAKEDILKFIQNNPGVKGKAVRMFMGTGTHGSNISIDTYKGLIDSLKSKGLITIVGTTRAARYYPKGAPMPVPPNSESTMTIRVLPQEGEGASSFGLKAITILTLVRDNPGIQTKDLFAKTGFSVTRIKSIIRRLIDSNLVERRGEGNSCNYAITESGIVAAQPLAKTIPIRDRSVTITPVKGFPFEKKETVGNEEKSDPYKRLLPLDWDDMPLSKRIDFVSGVKHEGFREYLLGLDGKVKTYLTRAKNSIEKPLNLYITVFSIPADNYSEESKNLLKTFVSNLNLIGRGKLQYVELSEPHIIEVREIR